MTQKEFEEHIRQTLPEFNPIPEKEISLLKIKLGKSHRKESDWTVIKDILRTHDLITINLHHPVRHLKSVRGIICEDGCLRIFTNMDDCSRYIYHLQSGYPVDRFLQLASVTLEYATDVADEYHMPIYIDMIEEPGNMFIAYDPIQGKLTATLLAKPF